MKRYLFNRLLGFSLIELMIVVVIIGILTTIAIPSYQDYVRKSRTAEAESNVSSIAQYEEQYYSENNKYYGASPNPTSVPSVVDTGGALTFNASSPDWVELGAVFTNSTSVRFQYRIGAGQFTSTAADGTGTNLIASTANLYSAAATTTGGATCSFTPASRSAQSFGITPVAYANWFVVSAIGNQKLGANNSSATSQRCSLFVKVNDRPSIYKENDTE